jgi:hypothetical protein
MTQNGATGVRYIWRDWSDSGDLTHTITPQAGAQTITANFRTEYQLIMNTDGAGSVTPQTGWYNPGAGVPLTATPDAGQTFTGWEGSGPGSYTGTDNPATITMNGPISQTARFTGGGATREVIVQTAPPGRRFTVDGQSSSNTETFEWTVGTTHSIGTTSPLTGSPGSRYIWNSWSNGQPIVFDYTVSAGNTLTLTANFDIEYRLTMETGTGGTVSPESSWQLVGTHVQILATPQAGYEFERWEGSGASSYTGTDNPATVTITNAMTEIASFRQVSAAGDTPALPATMQLRQNAPNPFSAVTVFSFILPRSQTVSLVVTDLLGRECARVLNQRELSSGEHRYEFNADRLRPGVYLYRLESGEEYRTGRMVVLR